MPFGKHGGECARIKEEVQWRSKVRFGASDCRLHVVICNESVCRVLSLLGTQFCLLSQVKTLECTKSHAREGRVMMTLRAACKSHKASCFNKSTTRLSPRRHSVH